MNAHITKPIHIETMLRTMAQWISKPAAADALLPVRARPPRPPIANVALDTRRRLGLSAWATKSFTDVCWPASWTASPRFVPEVRLRPLQSNVALDRRDAGAPMT